jgi:hypothetical protein
MNRMRESLDSRAHNGVHLNTDMGGGEQRAGF